MKRLFSVLVLSIACMSVIEAQHLYLKDMELMITMKSWVDVSHGLTRNGWVYYNSSDALKDGSKKITWGYNIDRSREMAKEWFYLYVDAANNDKICGMMIRFSDDDIYNRFISSIPNSGYKRSSSKIEDGRSIITYKKSPNSIRIITAQETGGHDDNKVTTYEIFLYRNNSLLDYDNGEKSYKYDDGSYATYTLKNGEVQGDYIIRYENGNTKAVVRIVNKRLTGKATSYDENGNVLIEATMIDTVKCDFTEYRYDEKGQMSKKIQGNAECALNGGQLRIMYRSDSKYHTNEYKDGEIVLDKDVVGNFLNAHITEYDSKKRPSRIFSSRSDTLVGEFKSYRYNEADRLVEEVECNYIDGKKDGQEIVTRHITESISEIYERNYKNGELEGLQKSFRTENGNKSEFENYTIINGHIKGSFRYVSNDSVYVGGYDANNELTGNWTCYFDAIHSTDSTLRTTDTSNMVQVESGTYNNGKKHGKWHYHFWEKENPDYQVSEYVYENGDWAYAIIEKGSDRRQFTNNLGSILITEYVNERKNSTTNYRKPSTLSEELNNGHITGLLELSIKEGKYKQYDSEDRIVVSGYYSNSAKYSSWEYYYYDQNCVIKKTEPYGVENFLTIDTQEPMSGKVTISDEKYVYEISVKKGVREGTTKIYLPGEDKPFEKERYKEGVRTK